MPKLQSTYDKSLIYKTSYEEPGTIHSQNCTIVWDIVPGTAAARRRRRR